MLKQCFMNIGSHVAFLLEIKSVLNSHHKTAFGISARVLLETSETLIRDITVFLVSTQRKNNVLQTQLGFLKNKVKPLEMAVFNRKHKMTTGV